MALGMPAKLKELNPNHSMVHLTFHYDPEVEERRVAPEFIDAAVAEITKRLQQQR
ncbi:MAG: hypothetical protein V1881_00635 [Candidatus Micrarchaeota archaeon]